MDCARPSLSLFNGFALRHGTERLAVPLRAQRLVAMVALRTSVSRRHAGGILWPEIPEVRAGARLRSTLWRLRQSGPDILRRVNGQLTLIDEVDLDVRCWLRLALRILNLPEAASRPDLAALRARGELLPGWCDDWVLLERERLRQLQLHALEAVAGRLLAEGSHAAALDYAWQALCLEPARESAHRLVIRIHLAGGDTEQARRQFCRCERVLAEELGLRPSKALTDLLSGSER